MVVPVPIQTSLLALLLMEYMLISVTDQATGAWVAGSLKQCRRLRRLTTVNLQLLHQDGKLCNA